MITLTGSDLAVDEVIAVARRGEKVAPLDGPVRERMSRSNQWIERYGDPRGKDIDYVVDWVEQIPFTETRNYVQRVMENYQVYKTRLGRQSDIVGDLRFGRP